MTKRLIAILLAAGLLVGPVGDTFIAPAVSAITEMAAEVHLGLWHGVNTMLILSVVTVLAGIAAGVGASRR